MRGIFYLIALFSALWMIYDIWLVNKELKTQDRVLWTVFAFVFSLGAAIIYLLSHKLKVLK